MLNLIIHLVSPQSNIDLATQQNTEHRWASSGPGGENNQNGSVERRRLRGIGSVCKSQNRFIFS